MKTFTLALATIALSVGGAINAFGAAPGIFDISKLLYKGKHRSNVFESERMQQIEKANAILQQGKAPRFGSDIDADAPASQPNPNLEFGQSELHGDMDAPDGTLWFYSGSIEYKENVVNEYYTEYLPQSFEVTIYNSEMKEMGKIASEFTLKEDEARVREVEVLPVVTRNYFNQDDNYEVALSVIVNPKPYGVRPYTYVYSLGGEVDGNGNSVPVMTLNRLVSDVCNASTADEENVVMSFVINGNESGVAEEEIEDRYWEYQLGNYIKIESYAKADAQGKLQKVFDKKMIYLQTQGNQQDYASAMFYVRNGKPCIVYPYYEEVFYEPYTMYSDMTQHLPNNLVVELYELNDIAKGFELTQTTRIAMSLAPDEGVIASYYGIGGFRYTDDVIYGDDGKASFIVTRVDYVASSDTELQTYLFYGPDGQLKKQLMDNALSHTSLSDLSGFDPMELIISTDVDGNYVFNFMNMRTMDVELSMPQGLQTDDSEEPDYIMANLDRVKSGDSFMYVAEMSVPEYDDFNQTNFMRAAWITRDGKLDHIDRINMGTMVNYASLYINSIALDPDYFHISPEQEYMMLIKRAFSDDSSKAEEQLLIGQATSDANPLGQDLLLLGNHPQYGSLKAIVPYTNPNRLSVTYGNVGATENFTTVYYDLPFNKSDGIIDQIASPATGTGFTFDGTIISAPGSAIELISLQGITLARNSESLSVAGYAPGIYLVRANGTTGKIAVK